MTYTADEATKPALKTFQDQSSNGGLAPKFIYGG
ncbi:hypothetical protein NIES4072_37150 [Nostoc commune NIES-4072]|uniref:Uncharacterized protein n=1 Tax=Nostoc commune NIES-4072 TaxID=2005467 RepID=A0A2R5FMQ1_NOSCO|nr:hypothetical protein NIES4070_53610 [Nostoc commune HK-02]GBG20046.1 hypothetical protein NIES4072_37150 [Nostoc commune NIES-4072]